MNNKNKYIILLATACAFGASAQMYPDSVDTNKDMSVSIHHQINGEMVGGNPLTNITYGVWSSWETSSFMGNCTPWSPDPSTVLLGKVFIQTTICDAEETRSREVTYHYQNGATNVITETETVATKVDDEDEAIGTKDYISGTNVTYSIWYRSGSLHSCSNWSPLASTVDEGKSFTQSRTCSQDYMRYKYTNNVWASGNTSIKSTENEYKTDSVGSSRTAIGTKVNYVWRSTGKTKRGQGGNARSGAPCSVLGSYDYGWTGEAGQSSGTPLSYEYKCVRR